MMFLQRMLFFIYFCYAWFLLYLNLWSYWEIIYLVYKLFLPSENSTLAEACCSVSVEFCIIGFKYIGNAHFLASADTLIRQTSN